MRFTATTFYIVILILFSSVFAVAKPSGMVLAVIHKANTALSEKKTDEAIAILEGFRENKHNEYILYSLLGNLYYEKSSFQKASEYYLKALKIRPEHFESKFNLARIHYEKEEFKKAGQLFEESFSSDRNKNLKILYMAASSYYQVNLYDRVKSIYARIFESKNGIKTEWLKLLIFTYFETKEWKKAEDIALTFLNKKPLSEKIWQLLAKTKLNTEDYFYAAACLEISYLLKKPEDKHYKDLAEIYLYLGAPLKAERTLSKIEGIKPDLTDRKVECLVKAQRMKIAEKLISEAIEAAPAFKRYFTKGKILYETEQFDNAVEAFTKSLELKPDNPEANLLKGMNELNRKKYSSAKKSFSKASSNSKFRDQAGAALEAIKYLEELKKSIESMEG